MSTYGTLLKMAPRGQETQNMLTMIRNTFSPDYRERFFALVAFEPEFEREHTRESHLEQTTDTDSFESRGKERPVDDCEHVLVWFEREQDFEAWIKALTVVGSTESPRCKRVTLSFERALKLVQVMGSLPISSLTVPVHESLRLDLAFRALELTTSTRNYTLGVDNDEEFARWQKAINKVWGGNDGREMPAAPNGPNKWCVGKADDQRFAQTHSPPMPGVSFSQGLPTERAAVPSTIVVLKQAELGGHDAY